MYDPARSEIYKSVVPLNLQSFFLSFFLFFFFAHLKSSACGKSMLSPSKRTLTTTRCLSSAGLGQRPAKECGKQLVPQLQLPRGIHSSQTRMAQAPARWPMRRVRIPWIDALTKSHEANKAPEPRPKPNLTPQKMSDTYYSAVSIRCMWMQRRKRRRWLTCV